MKEISMNVEKILSQAPRILTQSQREFYFSEGYSLLEKLIGDEWIGRLRDATNEMIDRSRSITQSD